MSSAYPYAICGKDVEKFDHVRRPLTPVLQVDHVDSLAFNNIPNPMFHLLREVSNDQGKSPLHLKRGRGDRGGGGGGDIVIM